MELTFSADTHVGRVRLKNEDNYLIDPELQLFVVCDGMGGHAGGDVASSMCVRTVREYLMAHADIITQFDNRPDDEVNQGKILELIKHAISHANLQIYHYASRDPSRKGMGTTCSLLMLRGNQAFVSHVGDSRIYLSRDGKILQVTDDHSLVMELVRNGRLSEEEAKHVSWKNALTRAVGVRKKLEVATYHLNTLEKDAFILCSDGLTTYFDVNDDRPLRALFSAKTIKDTTRLAIKFALQHGGTDNVTCLSVHVDSQDDYIQPDLESVRQTLRKTPFFQSCNSTELMSLINCARRFELTAGRQIPQWSFEACQLFIVLAGSLSIKNYFYCQSQSSLRVLTRGNFFGAAVLFGGSVSNVGIEAHEHTVLLGIGATELQATLKQNPLMAAKIMWHLGKFAVEDARQNIPANDYDDTFVSDRFFSRASKAVPEAPIIAPPLTLTGEKRGEPYTSSEVSPYTSTSEATSHKIMVDNDDPGERTQVDGRFHGEVLQEKEVLASGHTYYSASVVGGIGQAVPISAPVAAPVISTARPVTAANKNENSLDHNYLCTKIRVTPDPFASQVKDLLDEDFEQIEESEVPLNTLLSQVHDQHPDHQEFVTLFDDGDEIDCTKSNPLRDPQAEVNPLPSVQEDIHQDATRSMAIPHTLLQMMEPNTDSSPVNPAKKNSDAMNIEVPHYNNYTSSSSREESFMHNWKAGPSIADSDGGVVHDPNYSSSAGNDTRIDARLKKNLHTD